MKKRNGEYGITNTEGTMVTPRRLTAIPTSLFSIPYSRFNYRPFRVLS